MSGYSISPTFNRIVTSYTLTVPNTTSSITIRAMALESRAQGVAGAGTKSLSVGGNTCEVVVTAEDGITQKTYSIAVTREAASTNANLSALSVSGFTINPTFNPSTTSYTLSVPNATSSITINTTAADSKAKSITGTGANSLNVGTNTCMVVVIAEDNSTKTYTIVVTRQAASEPQLSNNANLVSLSVSGYTISPAFNANTTNYTLTVPYATSRITISATPADNNAQSVTGIGVKNLTVGSNTCNVIVKAENGVTQKTYTIVVTRQPAPALSSNANLVSLSVSGFTISPAFNANTTSYTLTVPNSTSGIAISATAADSKAKITGNGYKSLVVGSNTCKVVVTAEDGTMQKTYTITVTRMAANAIATIGLATLCLYPNPTTGELKIENEELKIGDKVSVYSLQGALVKQFTIYNSQCIVDISHLPAGTYIVKAGNAVVKK